MLLKSRLQILHFGRSVAAGVITEAALLQDSPRGLPRPRPPPLELSGDFGTLTSVLSLSQISLLPISSSTSSSTSTISVRVYETGLSMLIPSWSRWSIWRPLDEQYRIKSWFDLRRNYNTSTGPVLIVTHPTLRDTILRPKSSSSMF